MEVWVLMDVSESPGVDAVIGIYSSELEAKLRLADYVLDHEVQTYNLELTTFKVIGEV